jgi:hypothetical protein
MMVGVGWAASYCQYRRLLIRLPDPIAATIARMWGIRQVQFAPNPAGGIMVQFLIAVRYLFLAVLTRFSEVKAVFLLTSQRRGRRYTLDVESRNG